MQQGILDKTASSEPSSLTLIDTITLEELMASDEVTEWRIDDFLPKGCIAVISGISGVKRSFWLQQLALALATGEDFLGCTIPEKCRVFMYEAELTKGQLRSRAFKMLTIYPCTTDLMFNKKYSLRLDKNPGALTYTMDALNIDVCILDPLYMLHGGDIKDEQDMMVFLNPLEEYCLETGKNIVIAAHSTKIRDMAQGRQSNRGASGGAVKGSSAQVQVAAYVWTLSDRFESSNDGDLIFEKTRDMPRPSNLPLRFRDDTFTFLPKNVSDNKRIDYLKRKQPKDGAEARELLMRRYGIGRSKAYDLVRAYHAEVDSA